jgi:molecular chaperone DnaK
VLQTAINLPFITADATGPKHLDMQITRSQFEELTRSLVDRMRAPFEHALKDAGMTVKDIDEIVLVGGSTRMPMVENLVRELTGKEPRKGVNPDEVVAIGAAIQAAIMTGGYSSSQKSIVLVDVLPLSLGVETQGGVMSVMIPRNTPLPYRHQEIYTTARDFQDSVEIKILQGERPLAQHNRLLGVFALEGIPPAPKGAPRIEVAFDVDTNGILSVSAKDLATGKTADVRITSSTNLSREQVEQMIRDAEAHAQEDAKRRALIEARYELESLTNKAAQFLDAYREQLPSTTTEELTQLLQEARSALQSNEEEQLRAHHQRLLDSFSRAGEALYAQGSASYTPSASEEVTHGDSA